VRGHQRVLAERVDAAGAGRGRGGGGRGRDRGRGDGLHRAHDAVDALRPGDEEEQPRDGHEGEAGTVVPDTTKAELQGEDAPGRGQDLRHDAEVRLGPTADLLGESQHGDGDGHEGSGLPVPLPPAPHDPRPGAEGTDDGEDEQDEVVDGLEHWALQDGVET